MSHSYFQEDSEISSIYIYRYIHPNKKCTHLRIECFFKKTTEGQREIYMMISSLKYLSLMVNH